MHALRRHLVVWGPLCVWLGVIAVTSTELGARSSVDVWYWRLLHEWLPQIFGREPSGLTPQFLPAWARKAAHVTEYAVLALLTWRSLARVTAWGRAVLAGAALALCATVAGLDEWHQSFLAARTGAVRDVAIDLGGAVAGTVGAWLGSTGGRAPVFVGTLLDGGKVELRRARRSDSGFLYALHRSTLAEYVDQVWGWDENRQRAWFYGRFDPMRSKVVQVEGRDAGVLAVRLEGAEIFLASIQILPELQGKGVGATLIGSVLAEAFADGRSVRLQVLRVNPARSLYERLGFRVVEETDTHLVMQARPSAGD